jgi:hypothetical protein
VETMKEIWELWRDALVHPYSVAGYFLSPQPKIMEHCRNKHTKAEKKIVEELLCKLLVKPHPDPALYEELCDQSILKFWDEWEEFSTKTGEYDNPRIWKSPDIPRGDAHVWHKKWSLRNEMDTYLGKFACIVCSKTLGIVSAEHSWRDTKHIKDGQRSGLSASATNKSTTIYGSAQMHLARIHHRAYDLNPHHVHENFWSNDNIKMLGMGTKGIDLDKLVEKPDKIFNAYFEDWEWKVKIVNDEVNWAWLEQKYIMP